MVHVGVDACPDGWIAVAWEPGVELRGVFVPGLRDLVEVLPGARGFAVDIPIGLPTTGPRSADVQARRLLGPRGSSVFTTPVRAALQAPTHAEASAISRRVTGQGVSRQAYGLAARIFEAEAWRDEVAVPVWESHPEVSFTVLLGHPPGASKKRWAGMMQRRRALAAAGLDVDDLGDLGDAGARANVDDVLDAAVLAWTARRLVAGHGTSLPDPPEVEPTTGDRMAIWA